MTEIWKDIKGFEGKYQVSNIGRVRSLDRVSQEFRYGKKVPINLKGKILKGSKRKDKSGYKTVSLGAKKVREIHRLVAEHFLDKPNYKCEVNHIDFDKYNNCVSNLQWVTRRSNLIHNILHKRHSTVKLTPEIIKEIRTRRRSCELTMNLAKEFGVSRAQIRNIVARRSWIYVD
jgi:uncharacterized protein YjiS (DUF1127 family)